MCDAELACSSRADVEVVVADQGRAHTPKTEASSPVASSAATGQELSQSPGKKEQSQPSGGYGPPPPQPYRGAAEAPLVVERIVPRRASWRLHARLEEERGAEEASPRSAAAALEERVATCLGLPQGGLPCFCSLRLDRRSSHRRGLGHSARGAVIAASSLAVAVDAAVDAAAIAAASWTPHWLICPATPSLDVPLSRCRTSPHARVMPW